MTSQFSSRWTPPATPAVIKWLMIVTASTAILSALLSGIFHLFNYLGPQELLSLSWPGLHQWYIWQPLTYLFVLDSSGGITFGFLISLFLDLYFLWILGSTLQESIGDSHLISLYLISGILAGLAAVTVMMMNGLFITLAGPSAALLALLVAWTICYSDSVIFLFFLIPIKAKWLLVGVFSTILLVYISKWDFVSLAFYTTAALVGYLYSILVLKQNGPFHELHPFENWIKKISNPLHQLFQKKNASGSKIVNLKGEPILSDDDFVDLILTKIAKNGERSLTYRERQRMDQIAKRRSKK